MVHTVTTPATEVGRPRFTGAVEVYRGSNSVVVGGTPLLLPQAHNTTSIAKEKENLDMRWGEEVCMT